MNQALSDEAEKLRQQLKSLLPHAQDFDRDEQQNIWKRKDGLGNTLYGGPLLDTPASGIIATMALGKGWGWNIAIFAEPRPIKNELQKIYLVPLSKHATITPGGQLEEGCFTFIEGDPSLSPDVPVLFIACL